MLRDRNNMNVGYILGGVAATTVIILIGGNIYADKKLQDFYQLNHNSALQIKVNTFDMGLLSGEAKSTVSLNLDPCHPQDKLSFEVIDTIKRHPTGYVIHSRILYPYQTEQNLKRIFGQQDPLRLETKIKWSGAAQFHLSSPVIEHKDDDFFFQSKGMDLKFNLSPTDYKHFQDFSLVIPAITIGDQSNYFALEQFNAKTNHMHLSKIIPNATSEASAHLIRFKSYSPHSYGVDVNLQQLKAKSQILSNNKLLNLKNSFEIEKITLADAATTGKVKFNLSVNELDAAKFQTFYDVIDRNSTVCNPNAEQEILNAFLDMLGQGVKVASKENIFSLGKSQITTEFEATLNKGKYDNLDMFVAALPMQLTAQGRLETSRAFIHDILTLSPQHDQNTSMEQVETIIQQLSAQGMLKEDGNRLVSRFEYKFGEPRFSNY